MHGLGSGGPSVESATAARMISVSTNDANQSHVGHFGFLLESSCQNNVAAAMDVASVYSPGQSLPGHLDLLKQVLSLGPLTCPNPDFSLQPGIADILNFMSINE